MARVSRRSLPLLYQVDGGNPTDALDALSRAMLKAWEKVQKYATGEIANFKGWLTRLTHNLCVDIHRERSRGANRVENIEVYASQEEQGLVSFDATPLSAMDTAEKTMVIRRAIALLTDKTARDIYPALLSGSVYCLVYS